MMLYLIQDKERGDNMKAFTLRLSDKLNKTLKHHLVEKELSMQQYIVALIKKDLNFSDEDDDLSDYTRK